MEYINVSVCFPTEHLYTILTLIIFVSKNKKEVVTTQGKLVCNLCGKKFPIKNIKNPIEVEAKRHNLAVVTLEPLKRGEQVSYFVCEECFNALAEPQVKIKEGKTIIRVPTGWEKTLMLRLR